MRRRYIQDRITGRLVPAEEYRRPVEPLHFIQPDMPAYQSMITWGPVDGRKAHREHLKIHGCRQVEPSEKPAWMREKEYERRHSKRD